MSFEGPQLPVGTQVVVRVAAPDDRGGTAQRGATGRVAGSRRTGGTSCGWWTGGRPSARRDQLSLRTAYQDEALGLDAAGW